jgi:septum formation protein
MSTEDPAMPPTPARPKCALRLFLASASPRRLELLRQLGLEPQVVVSQVVETRLPRETPDRMVLRLAEEKARAAAARIGRNPPALIVAADTAVVIGGEPLGKPADAAEATAMLRRLRGREHEVLSATFLLRTDDGRSSGGVDRTRVLFGGFDEEWIRSYVSGGEPMDKAGAYAIQGGAAAVIDRIEGSWSNVVGLALEPFEERLAQIDIRIEQLTGRAAQPPASSL